MRETGWWLLLFGVLHLGFTAYHYFHARGWAADARGGEGATASKWFAVGHVFRGIGSLIFGLLLLAGGVIMILAG